MRTSNRLSCVPVPVTRSDLAATRWCPVCKTGSIVSVEGTSTAQCSRCEQRYRVTGKESEDAEKKLD